jgi:hypothetical protein
VHLVTSVPHDDLGEPTEELSTEDLNALQVAARSLIAM